MWDYDKWKLRPQFSFLQWYERYLLSHRVGSNVMLCLVFELKDERFDPGGSLVEYILNHSVHSSSILSKVEYILKPFSSLLQYIR